MFSDVSMCNNCFALKYRNDGRYNSGSAMLYHCLMSVTFVTSDFCKASSPRIFRVSCYPQLYKTYMSIVKQSFSYNQQRCQIKVSSPKRYVLMHTCNTSTWRQRQEEHEFKDNLYYIVNSIAGPFLKKKNFLERNFSHVMR
jgi:hypothetical protein